MHNRDLFVHSNSTGMQVPVLVDGDQVVHDSWQIAEYLDKTYTDKPMGLKSPTGIPMVSKTQGRTLLTVTPANSAQSMSVQNLVTLMHE